MSRNKSLFWLVACALVSLLLWMMIGSMNRITEQPVTFVLLYFAAFTVYACAVCCVLRMPSTKALLILILAIGFLFRLFVIASPPSDDIYRYLWEGKIQSAGYNPYQLAPADPKLHHLAQADPYHDRINHPEWTGIYLPLTMLWHRAVSVISYTPLAMKISFVFAEAMMVFFLLLLLRKRSLRTNRILLYAWNPLPILAIALEGHHESISLMCVMAVFLLLYQTKTSVIASGLWVLSVLAKGFSIVLAPVLWNRIRLWHALPMMFLVLLAGYPFDVDYSAMTHSLIRFGGDLHYNDSLHALASLGFGMMMSEQAAQISSRVLMGILWCAVLMLTWKRTRHDLMHRAAILTAMLLLVLPTVHIWYFVAIIPFFCFFPWTGWMLLTGSCGVIYLSHIEINQTGIWTEWHELKPIEYAPLFFWFSWCFRNSLRQFCVKMFSLTQSMRTERA